MAKRIAHERAVGFAVLLSLAVASVALLIVHASGVDPLNPAPPGASSYDPAVGFHPWDSCGRETPTESWPAWLAGWSSDSTILTNPPMWHVSPDLPAAAPACLYFVLDRKVLTNDLSMEVTMLDSFGPPGSPEASLYLDLLATNNVPVATEVYGDLITGSNEVVQLQIGIPLVTSNEAAAILCLRRGAGEIAVYDIMLREATIAESAGVERRPGAPVGMGPLEGENRESGDGKAEEIAAGDSGESGQAGEGRGADAAGQGMGRGKVLYVDGASGDDNHDGFARARENATRGPKKTINGALRASQPGDHITVLPGHYREDVNDCGKGVTMYFDGDVVVE